MTLLVIPILGWSSSALAADPTGCSDGGREGYTDLTRYPIIASCGGAWDVPGVFHDGPQCDRKAGNGNTNAAGLGCNVEDLCGEGWHVCHGPDDIDIRTGGRGCQDAVAATYPNAGSGTPTVPTTPGGAFFMTRTSGSGTGNCDEVVNGFPQSFNDVFGCGTMGSTPQPNCAPLDRFGHNQCQGLHSYTSTSVPATAFGYTESEWAWTCNDGAGGINESKFVVKSRPDDQGGVLCCKNTDPSLPEKCDRVDNDEDGSTDETDFDGDGAQDDLPGDPCTTTENAPGIIACTGSGGWKCVPAPVVGCCLPTGACSDVVAIACTRDLGGAVQTDGVMCGAAATACPQPCTEDIDDDELCDPTDDPCVDVDGDGYGVGAACLGPDCNDAVATCTTDCESDFNGADGNGIPDCEEATCLDLDRDGFGLGDGCTATDCNDTESACTTDCTDLDGDNTPNCTDDDDDGDGLDDRVEMQLGTDPLEPDSDGDGLSDGDEVTAHDTDPGRADSDGDGVPDGDEVLVHDSDPTAPDSDGDGVSDGDEVSAGKDPTDATDAPIAASSASGCNGSSTTLFGLLVLAALVSGRRRDRSRAART